MDNTKHTPGPWTFNEKTDCIQSEHPDHRFSLIAKVATGEDIREEHANARLIAAAPEMYEALKNALNTIRALTEDYDTRQSFIKGQELIARVEGEL